MKRYGFAVIAAAAITALSICGCSSQSGNEAAAPEAPVEAVSEQEEETVVSEPEPEPELETVEISSEEYLTDYPLHLEDRDLYVSIAPGFFFFPDRVRNKYRDEDGNVFDFTYLDAYNAENVISCFPSEDSDFLAEAYIICGLSTFSQIEWNIENKDLGPSGDGSSTIETTEIEICDNGFGLYKVEYIYPRYMDDMIVYEDGLDYDAYTSYIFEKEVDGTFYQIIIDSVDNYDQDYVDEILDFYRTSEAPFLEVDTANTQVVIK